MKKAKATNKGPTKRPARGIPTKPKKKRSHKGKKEINLAEVRKEITQIVGSEAAAMTQAVVGEGLKVQLAPVKYLFEASGIYPATPGTEGVPEENSLAFRLLRHLGLPTTPVVSPDDDAPAKTLPTSLAAKENNEVVDEESDELDSGKKSEASSEEEELKAAPEGSGPSGVSR